MEEGISSKTLHIKLKLILSFFITILTLLLLTTFTVVSSHVDQVEAATMVDPNCGVVDQKPSGKCDVDIDYDRNCNPSSRNCNIDIDVVANPQPSGNNELKLDYYLETGIKCNKVAGGLAGKAACLANSLNDYKTIYNK